MISSKSQNSDLDMLKPVVWEAIFRRSYFTGSPDAFFVHLIHSINFTRLSVTDTQHLTFFYVEDHLPSLCPFLKIEQVMR